jgi:hypothetical protein
MVNSTMGGYGAGDPTSGFRQGQRTLRPERNRFPKGFVMAGLVPAIHVVPQNMIFDNGVGVATWMPGSSPGMTVEGGWSEKSPFSAAC